MKWTKNFIATIKKKYFPTEAKSSFDTYNHETRLVTIHSGFSGIRTEVSKNITSFFQLSKVLILDQQNTISQLFGTISLNKSLIQLSLDHEKSMQIRATHVTDKLVSKVHTIISCRKNIFTQIEAEIRNVTNNFTLKLISPAIKGANLIYVLNGYQQLGKVGLGTEIIGTESELGISFCGRCNHKNKIFSVGLQQFTSLSFCYYHKINKLLDYGAEVQISKGIPHYAAVGLKMTANNTEIKTSVNSSQSLGFSIDNKLNENLTFNLNAELGRKTLSYGFGFSLEF